MLLLYYMTHLWFNNSLSLSLSLFLLLLLVLLLLKLNCYDYIVYRGSWMLWVLFLRIVKFDSLAKACQAFFGENSPKISQSEQFCEIILGLITLFQRQGGKKARLLLMAPPPFSQSWNLLFLYSPVWCISTQTHTNVTFLNCHFWNVWTVGLLMCHVNAKLVAIFLLFC